MRKPELMEELRIMRYLCSRICLKPGNNVIARWNDNGKIDLIDEMRPYYLYEHHVSDGDYELIKTIDFRSIGGRKLGHVELCKDAMKAVKYNKFGKKSYPMNEKRSQLFFKNPANFGLPETIQGNEVDIIEPQPIPEPPSSIDHDLKVNEPSNETATRGYSRTLRLHVPLRIIELIDQHIKGKTARRRAKDVIYFILKQHQLRGQSILKFLPYHHTIKERLLTSRFYKVWDQLVALGILELYADKNGITFSWKRKIPKRYRINPQVIGKPYQTVEVELEPKDYEVEEGELQNYTAEVLSNLTIEKPAEDSFNEMVEDMNLSLKAKVFSHVLSDKKIDSINKGLDSKQISNDFDRGCIIEYDVRNRIDGMVHKLMLLQNGMIYCSRSELNGRLSHNLTNLNTILHPLLALDGDRIAEFDLSNAFPLIFSKALLTLVTSAESEVFDMPMLREYLYAPKKKLPHSFNPNDLYNLRREVTDFHDSCVTGSLYAEMQELISDDQDGYNKTFAKKTFIKVMFDDYNHNNSMKTAFRKRFPMIVSLIDGFKQYMYRYFDQEKDKKGSVLEHHRKYFFSSTHRKKTGFQAGNSYLPIRLQEIESKIFVDRILLRLKREGLLAFSRHDAICCKESDRHHVKTIVREELDKVFGKNQYKLKYGIWKWQPRLETSN